MWSKKLGSQVESLGRTLVELGSKLDNLVVLDPDVSPSTRTTFFAERYPERYIKVGISEQDLIGIASGLASTGKIPVACGFAFFVTGRAWEQIANSIARPNLDAKLVGTHSGLSPHADGESHQSFWDVAMMRVLPNMKVVVPADSCEATEAVRALISTKGPGYLRLSRGSTPLVYDDDDDFRVGKARVVRDGQDATIIANGIMVYMAIEAAKKLSESGIDVGVMDMHTVKPLDERSIEKAARDTGKIVAAEEHSIIGGLGGAIAETLSENYPIPMMRVGIDDKFGQSSRQYPNLLAAYGLTPNALVNAVNILSKRDD